MEIAWWLLTRRKVRARWRLREIASDLPECYRLWLSFTQPEHLAGDTPSEPSGDPLFAVHMHIGNGSDGAHLDAAIRSLLRQSFQRWTLYVTGIQSSAMSIEDPRVYILPESAPSRRAGIEQVLRSTRAPYIVPLTHGSTLTSGALLSYAQAIDALPAGDAKVFYADQDERDRYDRRSNPWFKPQWDEDLFLAQDYLSTACALPARFLQRALPGPDTHDAAVIYAALTRLLLGPDLLRACHVRYVATTTPPDTWCQNNPDRQETISALLDERTGIQAVAGPFGTLILHRPIPAPPPRVSVIVPTRDRLDLLEACVEGVLHRTDYPNIELVIADNNSIEPETLAYFARCICDPRVRIVRWPHPYNYSAINNFAVTHASGSYLCLLNNDTEVIAPSWLHEMMAHAVRPKVGAVGAQLLYPDRSIQHAGVVVGMGGAAGHAHRGLAQGEPGYFAQSLVTRSATAVTAACLVVEKSKFEAVGGLDEENLAIAYNDVDFCLKLLAAGWRNIYAAQAVVIHHESKSRGLDFAPEHLARYQRELAVFQERWGTLEFQDPTHHPALDPSSEPYRLRL